MVRGAGVIDTCFIWKNIFYLEVRNRMSYGGAAVLPARYKILNRHFANITEWLS